MALDTARLRFWSPVAAAAVMPVKSDLGPNDKKTQATIGQPFPFLFNAYIVGERWDALRLGNAAQLLATVIPSGGLVHFRFLAR